MSRCIICSICILNIFFEICSFYYFPSWRYSHISVANWMQSSYIIRSNPPIVFTWGEISNSESNNRKKYYFNTDITDLFKFFWISLVSDFFGIKVDFMANYSSNKLIKWITPKAPDAEVRITPVKGFFYNSLRIHISVLYQRSWIYIFIISWCFEGRILWIIISDVNAFIFLNLFEWRSLFSRFSRLKFWYFESKL